MRYALLVGSRFQHSSGRVIALGRLLLATLNLIAVLVDASQPQRGGFTAYGILAAYLVFAAIIAVAVWNDWWLDATVSGTAHAIDILFFTLLVLLTEGYTSPYFTFFMFVLLAAAIRWGWRATALTAVLLVLLYLISGTLAAMSGAEIEVQNFVVRTGHLLILSLILIWFGASRWSFHAISRGRGQLDPPALDRSPVETALNASMARLHAKAGAFLWRGSGQRDFTGLLVRGGESADVELPGPVLDSLSGATPFLYDLERHHGMTRDAKRNLVEQNPADHIDPKAQSRLRLREGLGIPIEWGDNQGVMFLEGVRGLSSDHIDLGAQIAGDIAAHVQAHALLKAADEQAEARSRLTLARDLHDGVVQFLAGTAFRLEAMRRAHGAGRDLAPDLAELKQLVLQEQDVLRTFIMALRAGPEVSYADLTHDLKTLAERLSRQWDVACAFSARPADCTVPARLHLDAQQLVREAIANAVRHAAARNIRVDLACKDDELQLKLVNDGTAPRSPGGQLQMSTSLKERVDNAGGTLDITRGMDVTKISIALPIPARRR